MHILVDLSAEDDKYLSYKLFFQTITNLDTFIGFEKENKIKELLPSSYLEILKIESWYFKSIVPLIKENKIVDSAERIINSKILPQEMLNNELFFEKEKLKSSKSLEEFCFYSFGLHLDTLIYQLAFFEVLYST